MNKPNVTVIKDYDGVFEGRVNQAIEENVKNNIPMKSNITINSGPYRSYCMSFEVIKDTCHLDFYAAARVFGFEHTIEDISNSIKSLNP